MMTSLTSSVCTAFISRLHDYMIVYIWGGILLQGTKDSSILGLPGTFQDPIHLLKAFGDNINNIMLQWQMAPGRILCAIATVAFVAAVCYALQTATASSLSSQSSFPVSASLPIANSDMARPWTIFHLPSEQVTGKLNITPFGVE